jgi:nicotinamidase-related amidase
LTAAPACVVLALHLQNDVLHPEGRIRVGLDAHDPARTALIEGAGRLLRIAREREWPIVHVRIAFREDYADLARNMPIMRRTEEIGAVREGQWGSAFFEGLGPLPGAREFVVTHKRISAFYGTELDYLLRLLQAQRLAVAGVATHSVVESTVRDAADRGFEVSVLADVCAAADRAAHEASLASMRLIADVVRLDDWLDGHGKETA